MTFDPDSLGRFQSLFDQAAPRIRAFPGCNSLRLLQNERFPNILSTLSEWTDASALERYRQSDLFLNTWEETRALFIAPPRARSYMVKQVAD